MYLYPGMIRHYNSDRNYHSYVYHVGVRLYNPEVLDECVELSLSCLYLVQVVGLFLTQLRQFVPVMHTK